MNTVYTDKSKYELNSFNILRIPHRNIITFVITVESREN